MIKKQSGKTGDVASLIAQVYPKKFKVEKFDLFFGVD